MTTNWQNSLSQWAELLPQFTKTKRVLTGKHSTNTLIRLRLNVKTLSLLLHVVALVLPHDCHLLIFFPHPQEDKEGVKFL